MGKILISSSHFIGPQLPSVSRRGFHALPLRRLVANRVNFSLHEIPPIHLLDAFDFNSIVIRAEGLLYSLADAAVAVDPAATRSRSFQLYRCRCPEKWWMVRIHLRGHGNRSKGAEGWS